MRTFIFVAAIVLMAPALRAQQDEAKDTSAQGAPQPAAEPSSQQNVLPAAIRPGHPLDPADVKVLTGEKDRELEASRRAISPSVGMYGAYAGAYGLNRWRGGMADVSLLPLRRIDNPFFFFRMQPGGFGRGFGRSRFR